MHPGYLKRRENVLSEIFPSDVVRETTLFHHAENHVRDGGEYEKLTVLSRFGRQFLEHMDAAGVDRGHLAHAEDEHLRLSGDDADRFLELADRAEKE